MEKLNRLLLVVVLGLIWTAVQAQPSEEGFPPSFKSNAGGLKQQSSPRNVKTLSAPDVAALFEEDFIAQSTGELLPPRVAVILPVNYTMENSGEWTVLETGERVWRLSINVPNAIALSLTYDQFQLPQGAKLFIYSADKKHVLGAFTSANNPKSGPEFATGLVAGDGLILEYVDPGEETNPKIAISGVSYAYNDVYINVVHSGPSNIPGSSEGSSGSCMVNVNCSPEGDDWKDEKQGVAATLQKIGGGYYICSGSMLNNTAMDLTPYFLMAYHCYGSLSSQASAADLNQWMFYFNFERTGCANSTAVVSRTNSITGAQKRAAIPLNGGSDGLLLELNTRPPESWNVYYNGWDRRNTQPAGGVGIHHPQGDVKKISTYSANPVSSGSVNFGSEGTTVAGALWGVMFVATANGHGVTEGGSSGSPLFNSNGYVIGTLTGGNSACTNTSGGNYYGKMWYHWDRYSDQNQWMKPHLDPIGSNEEYLEGTYVAGIVTAGFIADQTNIYAAESITFTDTSHKAITWEWSFPGGSPSSYEGQTPPSILYNTPGSYTVTLTVNKGKGREDTKTVVDYIIVTQKQNECSAVVTIGAGMNTQSFPLGAMNRTELSSAIYTVAELNMPDGGAINTISWKSASSALTRTRTIYVYLKEVDETELTAATWASETDGATLVFQSQSVFVTEAGWVDLTLITPFAYSGTRNLKVLVRSYATAASDYQSSDCYYTSVTNAHMQWSSTLTSNPTTAGTVDSNRPNIRFGVSFPCGASIPQTDFYNGMANVLLSEDFDNATFPPSGWTINNPSTGTGISIRTWVRSSSIDYTSINPASTASAYMPYDGINLVNTWLISPAMAITSTKRTVAEFYLNYGGSYLNGGWINFHITTDDGATWEKLWTTGNSQGTGLNTAWRSVSVDLTSYLGQTVRLAWQYYGRDGWNIALDGVQVFDVTDKVVIFEGETVDFVDHSTGPPVTWQWLLEGSEELVGTDSTVTATYMNSGTYNVTLNVTNNLGANTKSVDAAVTVNARTPVALFSSVSENSFTMRSNDGQYLPKEGGSVSFIDRSAYYPKWWNWTLTGATPSSSTESQVQVTYPAGTATYPVVFQTGNSAGTATIINIPDYIQLGGTADIWNIPAGDPAASIWDFSALVTGSNTDRDMVAERFEGTTPGEVTKVDISARTVMGSPVTPVNVTIYSDEDGTPGVALSPTIEIPIAAINQTGYTTVNFPEPVGVGKNFFVVIGGLKINSSEQNLVAITASEKRYDHYATVYLYDNNVWLRSDQKFQDLYISMNIVPELTYTSAELASDISYKRKDIDATVETLTFTTTGRNWAVSGDSWINFSASAGTVDGMGAGSLTFTCSDNTNPAMRTGIISLNVAGTMFSIEVKQGGSYPANFTAVYDNENKDILLTWGQGAVPVGYLFDDIESHTGAGVKTTEVNTGNSSLPKLQEHLNEMAGFEAINTGVVTTLNNVSNASGPAAAGETILRWDSGIHHSNVGSASGGSVEVAVRFTPEDLQTYSSLVIQAVEIYPGAASSDMVLRIRQNNNIVYTQAVSGLTIGDFNRINLTSAYTVDMSKDLMVGYAYTQLGTTNNDYVAGCDAGPAVSSGNGDLISLNGEAFKSLSSISPLNFNWNMAVIAKAEKPAIYRIFRDGSMIVEGLKTQQYHDLSAAIGVTYCYAITATYEEDPFFESVQSPSTANCVFAKSPLVLTVGNKTKTENDPNPAFTGTVTGMLLDSDTYAMIEAMATYECEADELSPAGTYTIAAIVENTMANKYAVDPVDGVLTVNAYPSVVSQQPVGAIACQGQPFTFNVAGSGLEVTYRWQKQQDNNWVNIDGANAPSYSIASVTPADAGDYRVLICGRTDIAISNAVTLKVGLTPASILVFEWDDVPTINSNPATNGGYSFTSFQWYKNGVAIDNATKPYLPLDGAGSYDCEMTTADNRVFRLCNYTYQPASPALLVYPNPVDQGGNLTLKLQNTGEGAVVNIYSIGGALMKSNIPLHGVESTIDIAGLTQGLYIIQVVSPNGAKRTTKLVVK